MDPSCFKLISSPDASALQMRTRTVSSFSSSLSPSSLLTPKVRIVARPDIWKKAASEEEKYSRLFAILGAINALHVAPVITKMMACIEAEIFIVQKIGRLIKNSAKVSKPSHSLQFGLSVTRKYPIPLLSVLHVRRIPVGPARTRCGQNENQIDYSR
jgi:hypothetical protein